jgi:tetratricopeptide (TPR) repeat protein
LEALTDIIERLINQELDLKIKPPEPCAADIRLVYDVLEELRYVLLFTSEAVAVQGGSRALLAYSAANQLFERTSNLKGQAVSKYCISRLHFQAGRYVESITAMKDSLYLMKSIEERTQDANLKHFYKTWVRRRTLQMIKAMLIIAEEVSPDILEDAVFYIKADMNYKEQTDPEKALSLVQLAFSSVLLDRLHEVDQDLVAASRVMGRLEAPDYLLDFKGYTEGLFYEAQGYLRKAAEAFTRVLERSATLNPRTKAQCVKHLHEIFESRGLYSPQLKALQEGLNRRKDVVFLMDYSLSMEGPRINRALKGFLYLFDKALVADDRVSFVVFNRFPQVIFNLTFKGRNTAFLRNAIETCKL